MKRKFVGWNIIIGIGIVSYVLHQWIQPFIAFEMVTMSILLAMVIKLKFPKITVYEETFSYVSKHFLKIGIVFLGFNMSLETLSTIGISSGLLLGFWIAAVLGLSILLGKYFELPSKLALLIGIGSSICGASAIVALSPIVEAKEDEKIIAVSVVSILGTVGVLFFSLLALLSHFSEVEFGFYAGLSLQGVGHALAAAFSGGELAGEIGTITKMTRVLYIIPLAFILNIGKENQSKVIPYYVFMFILVAILKGILPLPEFVIKTGQEISKVAILFAMTALGLKVNFDSVKKQGKKVMVHGSLLFFIVLVLGFIVTTFLTPHIG
ncbi:MAG: putative sulfate exporter family transporter [Clostridia bacterium]|nr:putative sulfate exporter family transporter [Clostridia bacterium]